MRTRGGQAWAIPAPEVVGVVIMILVLTVGLGLFGEFSLFESAKETEAKNQFEAFVSDVREECRELDRNTFDDLNAGGYNFTYILRISVTPGPTLTAHGDDFTHEQDVADCEYVEFCDQNFQDCGQTSVLTADATQMRFEYLRSAGGVQLANRTGDPDAGECFGQAEDPSPDNQYSTSGPCAAIGLDSALCNALECTYDGRDGQRDTTYGCAGEPDSGTVCGNINDLGDEYNNREECITTQGCTWGEP